MKHFEQVSLTKKSLRLVKTCNGQGKELQNLNGTVKGWGHPCHSTNEILRIYDLLIDFSL